MLTIVMLNVHRNHIRLISDGGRRGGVGMGEVESTYE